MDDFPFGLLMLGIVGTAMILLFIMDFILWRRALKFSDSKDFVFFSRGNFSDGGSDGGSSDGGSDCGGGDCGGGSGI